MINKKRDLNYYTIINHLILKPSSGVVMPKPTK